VAKPASHQDDRNDLVVGTLTSALPDVVAIYRFGTHGSAFERSGSDVDLAVLGRSPLDAARIWEAAQSLARALGREVDLVNLATASTVLKAQVVTAGERLFCSDSACCDAYEDYILSAYARLNEERKGILTDVRARGSVYG
jgi:predicted nucleotidyltransferase